ncbi:MAG: anhydro-N-acetylmuramic acid kinase [Steroidobacterales bacterium]
MGLYVGLMSGTSMDAIDAALVDLAGDRCRVLAGRASAWPAGLKARVTHLIEHPEQAALDEIAALDVELGRAFAGAALELLRETGTAPREVRAVGSHGQTVRHRPDAATPFSLQLGDPNTVAELTGLTVVGDFRRRDVAAGGQGAPLVPAFHEQVFSSPDEDRAIVNIGGIANVTALRRQSAVVGFDTGPGNRLLDAWISRHRRLDFDRDGDWAQTGRCDTGLLQALLAEPYLALPAPKSTGRELFNPQWLDARLGTTSRRPQDVQATLLDYTAETIAAGVQQYAPGATVYLCGGGAHNRRLLDAIARRVAPQRVMSTAALGLDPDFVEAVAFAWFAHRTLTERTSTLPSVTGASGPRILGGIYR